MVIRLYDSRAQAETDFVPLQAGKVGMYVCGPTVQSSPHIGHLRSALVYDLWRRWFDYRGYDVTLVRNVTDIDDKVLDNASESEPWWAVAYRVELEFTRGYNALGILPPTYEPRATASLPGMQELIQVLIDKGHAYVAADGTGDVFFAVASWPSYGALTHQRPDDMAASPDAETRGKRDSRDFALWKGTKPGEPDSASWNSPWGPGRPGWHIECSAMSRRYLGPAFDIHGGGLDLRFPHHENELAQSTAVGDPFAAHWLHNGIVNVEGEKMSKSKGNWISVKDFLDAAGRPVVARYFLAGAHYRSTIDYHAGSLEEASTAYDRIEGFIERADDFLIENNVTVAADYEDRRLPVPEEFARAMDDDLNVPQALAVLHDTVGRGNVLLEGSPSRESVDELLTLVLGMVQVLGIHKSAPGWERSSGADWTTLFDSYRADLYDQLADRLEQDREAARARKDFAESDRIRDLFASIGVTIEDTASGPKRSI